VVFAVDRIPKGKRPPRVFEAAFVGWNSASFSGHPHCLIRSGERMTSHICCLPLQPLDVLSLRREAFLGRSEDGGGLGKN